MKDEILSRKRRLLRLGDWDYTRPGAYFITLVAHHNICRFGEIIDGDLRLNTTGKIILEEWERTSEIRREVDLDAYILMPNHLHAIVVLEETTQFHQMIKDNPHLSFSRSPRSLGALIAGFKSSTTKKVNILEGSPGSPLWQRNYYEHIIRNEADLVRIRRYIQENPARWSLDHENPVNRP